ncbi:MAG: hypothetical protein V7641_2209 [Blastocatellia bacterium]
MSQSATDGKLKATTVAVDQLAPAERARMLVLMQIYYDAVSEAEFLGDLAGKDAVILLKDARNIIQGFSTLVTLPVEVEGRRARGVFSGDTVLDKSYWGSRALGRAFLRYLFVEKLRSPAEPLYWLLISKGYKTYLMMANNFAEHYPRCERSTPARIKRLMDAFYTTLYPNAYDSATGLIETSGNAYRLKSAVAPIPARLIETNPRIAFFEQRNPRWPQGCELACIARMTGWMPLRFALKVIFKDGLMKPLKRLSRGLPATPKESDRNY